MKLNKPLIRKMIKRIETMPESYEQSVFVASEDYESCEYEEIVQDNQRPEPMCGTVACLAGEAIICNAQSVEDGIEELKSLDRRGKVDEVAEELLGLPHSVAYGLFFDWMQRWPQPYRDEFLAAKGDYKDEATAAVGLLTAILETDGKILEGEQ